VRVDGNRADDLAGGGEVVKLDARLVQIDSLGLLEMPDADTAIFEARCGKGTYVRALARDMGSELECLGHLIALRRTRVAPFEETQAVTVEALKNSAEMGGEALHRLLLPIEAALQALAVIQVGQN